jgi:hypothetical protein
LVLDVGGDFGRHLGFDPAHDFVMGFLGGHARDFFKFGDDGIDLGIEFLLLLIGGGEFLGQLIVFGIEGVLFLNEGGIALIDGLLP